MLERIMQTTDDGLTPSILNHAGDCLVLYYDADSHVGRDQLCELARFTAITKRKAIAVSVPRAKQDNPNRPIRLTRLPTLARFQNGQLTHQVEGLTRFNQIGAQLF